MKRNQPTSSVPTFRDQFQGEPLFAKAIEKSIAFRSDLERVGSSSSTRCVLSREVARLLAKANPNAQEPTVSVAWRNVRDTNGKLSEINYNNYNKLEQNKLKELTILEIMGVTIDALNKKEKTEYLVIYPNESCSLMNNKKGRRFGIHMNKNNMHIFVYQTDMHATYDVINKLIYSYLNKFNNSKIIIHIVYGGNGLDCINGFDDKWYFSVIPNVICGWHMYEFHINGLNVFCSDQTLYTRGIELDPCSSWRNWEERCDTIQNSISEALEASNPVYHLSPAEQDIRRQGKNKKTKPSPVGGQFAEIIKNDKHGKQIIKNNNFNLNDNNIESNEDEMPIEHAKYIKNTFGEEIYNQLKKLKLEE